MVRLGLVRRCVFSSFPLTLLAVLMITGCSADRGDSRGKVQPPQTTGGPAGLHQVAPPWRVGQLSWQGNSGNESIFTGNEWVPHRQYVQAEVLPPGGLQSTGLIADTPCTSNDCNPGGAHPKHKVFGCSTCHNTHGMLMGWFDPNGPAVIKPTAELPNPPKPIFNSTTKSCSNVACHGTPGGSFDYYFQGGDGEAVLNTFTYSASYATTPNWYTTGQSCSSCHGNPPRNGGVWHSGQHATTISGANDCQFCHSDASGSGGQGTVITNPALHRNGTIDVQAQFTSRCFGCH